MSDIVKPIDAWTEVLISDPLTNHISVKLSKIKGIHPLQITAISHFLKLLAASIYFIFLDSSSILPPVLFFLGILVDSMDGKIARITGKDVKLHGTIDFSSDVVTNSIFFLSMFLTFRFREDYFMWMLIWIIMMFIFIAITSNKWRLLSSFGVTNVNDTTDLKEKYDYLISSTLHNDFLKKLYHLYLNAFEKTSKYRLSPHPTVVDSEFVLFVIFPVLVALEINGAVFALMASVLLIIPDMIYQSTIMFLFTLKQNSQDDDNK